MSFSLRVDGIVRIKQMRLRHNHEPDIAFAKEPRRSKEQRQFIWNQELDNIIREGCLQGHSVEELFDTIKMVGQESMPSMRQISVRMGRMRKFLYYKFDKY